MDFSRSRSRVLVVVPTHDRVEFIAAALASLAAQTRQADEIVVTGNVGPGLITDAPLCDRLNSAIAASSCDAFIVLCDDDLVEPTFIEETMEVLEFQGMDIVYTDARFFGDSGGVWITPAWSRESIEANTVPPVTALCTRAMWERAGGYQSVPFFDWDFWWRCFYRGARAAKVERPLFLHRRHKGQAGEHEDLADSRARALARFDELRHNEESEVRA